MQAAARGMPSARACRRALRSGPRSAEATQSSSGSGCLGPAPGTTRRSGRGASSTATASITCPEAVRTAPEPLTRVSSQYGGGWDRIEAKPEHAADVEGLLTGALALAREETGTTVWFALRLGPTTFGVFDAFGSDEDRTAHLQGRIAAALMENAPKLPAEAPEILPVDILAAKLA